MKNLVSAEFDSVVYHQNMCVCISHHSPMSFVEGLFWFLFMHVVFEMIAYL